MLHKGRKVQEKRTEDAAEGKEGTREEDRRCYRREERNKIRGQKMLQKGRKVQEKKTELLQKGRKGNSASPDHRPGPAYLFLAK